MPAPSPLHAPMPRRYFATIVLFLSACGGEATSTLPPSDIIAAIDVQLQGRVGALLTPNPTVIVRDAKGNGVAGIPVTFKVLGGDGSVSSISQATAGDGKAEVSWTLGPKSGEQLLEATVAALPEQQVVFRAIAIPGPPALLSHYPSSSENQSGEVGKAVPIVPAVKVTDLYGNSLSGVKVTFVVTAGGGALGATEAMSNPEGIASAGGWTLGTAAGLNTVAATAAGVPTSTVFRATALAGPPRSIQALTTGTQTAVVGTAVATRPAALVKDSLGNPVPGVDVIFTVTGGGGAVSGGSQITLSDGTAIVGGWTLGTAAGLNRLSAAVAGLSSTVTFSATGSPGPVTKIVTHMGDNQTAPMGMPVLTKPSVKVTDSYGNGVAGMPVTFAVTAGGGTLTGASQTSDSGGIATLGGWTLGLEGGVNTISASTKSATVSVTLSATAVGTLVSGIIAANQTWSKSGAPFVLGAEVQVAYGVKLTVAPGTKVYGRGHKLTLFGELNAIGTAADSIHFDSLHLEGGNNTSGQPFFINVDFAVMRKGSFYRPSSSGYGSFALRNSRLQDLQDYTYVWYPVADCFIERNVFVRSGMISAGHNYGVKLYVRNNVFVQPLGDVIVNWASYGTSATIVEFNTFPSAGGTVLRLPAGYTSAAMIATNNYWGTTDLALIRSLIFDKNDDLASAGIISFEPVLGQAHPNTPIP